MKLKKIMRMSALAALALMPNSMKRFIYNRFLGADIHPTARIGISYIDVKKIRLDAYARIGHLNIIRNLELLELGENSWIGRLNNISALPLDSARHFAEETDRYPALIAGRDVELGNRHFYDCNNTIEIGDMSCILGFGTAIYTHGVNIAEVKQETRKISIGKNCRIYTRCVLVKGAGLPDNSFLGPHSVLVKAQTQESCFYSGVPAEPVKRLDYAEAYFNREQGFVD